MKHSDSSDAIDVVMNFKSASADDEHVTTGSAALRTRDPDGGRGRS